MIPAVDRLLARFGDLPVTVMRLTTGIPLMVHGWPKIMSPFGAAQMVERLGFAPGSFWSPVLSFSEFGAGVLLTLGLLTRPAAAVAAFILAVTIWFHWITLGQGWGGSEKSILWLGPLLYFAIRGADRWSADAGIGRSI